MGVDDITRNNVILMVFCLTISIVEIEVSGAYNSFVIVKNNIYQSDPR
jgi:hypothetical protein